MDENVLIGVCGGGGGVEGTVVTNNWCISFSLSSLSPQNGVIC